MGNVNKNRPTALACAFVLAALVLGGSLHADGLDGAAWRRDARNLLRYEKVASRLRAAMTEFAASRRDEQAIKGGEHLAVDRAMLDYARIRRAMQSIAAKWEEGRPEGLDPVRPVLLAAAAHVCMAENAVAMVENFAGTVWERKLSQEVRRRDLRVIDLFKDVSETLSRGEHQRAILEGLDVLGDEQGRGLPGR